MFESRKFDIQNIFTATLHLCMKWAEIGSTRGVKKKTKYIYTWYLHIINVGDQIFIPKILIFIMTKLPIALIKICFPPSSVETCIYLMSMMCTKKHE